MWYGFCCKFLGVYNSERNFENRSTFVKVMKECIVAQFLERIRIAHNALRCTIWRDSICPSVRHSVTFRYCGQTYEDTIVQFSASGNTIPLVS